MKVIVAPTNLSLVSLNAIDYATELAYRSKAELHLIYVYERNIKPLQIDIPGEDITMILLVVNSKMNSLKEKFEKKFDSKIKIILRILPGQVSSEILKYCALVNASAVVMGTEGDTGFISRLFFGATTLSVEKHICCPLIVIPFNCRFNPVVKIAFACDFKNVPETIPVKEIKDIFRLFKAELHIVHVSNDKNLIGNAEIRRQMSWLTKSLWKYSPAYHFIFGTDVENDINHFITAEKMDMLVVVPKKHLLTERIFEHIHSKHFVMKTSVPLIAIDKTLNLSI